MSLATRAAVRVGGFGASVLVTGLVGVATIPLVVRAAGATEWAALAVGQTLGAFLGVLTALGYQQLGPTAVARTPPAGLGRYFVDSLTLRGLTLAVTIPAALALGRLVSPGGWVVTAVAAMGVLVVSLGASWFFIGTASPRDLMLYDTLPRAVGTLAGAASCSVTGTALPAALGLLGGALAAVTLSAWHVLRRYGRADQTILGSGLWATARVQFSGLGIAVLSTAYSSLPLLYLSTVIPVAAPTYALADRLKQQAMTAFVPVAQTLQGWVPRAQGSDLYRRARKACVIAAALGIAAAAAFACFATPISAILSGTEVKVGLDLALPLGMAFGMNVATLIIGNAVLIPVGKVRAVLASAAAGMLVVVPTLLLAGAISSDAGVAWAVLLAQSAVLVTQLSQTVKPLRTARNGLLRPA